MTTVKERVNGSAVASPLHAVLTAVIELDRHYTGWHATMRINPPMRVVTALGSGEIEDIRKAMVAIISEWNFVDDDGQPQPLPKDGLDWESLPLGLEKMLYERYTAAMNEMLEVPKETSTTSVPTLVNGT